MKNIIIGFFLLIIFLIQSHYGYGKSYAILISGGYALADQGSDQDNIDHENSNQEKAAYWYDLVLAYETLINEAGYGHDDVLLFYAGTEINGNVTNWEYSFINNKRYDLKDRYNNDPDWNDIVDFSNAKQTVEELTLYVIELKKENDGLQEQIDDLK